MKNQNEQKAWNIFEETGKVVDYLSYKNLQAVSNAATLGDEQDASKDKGTHSEGSENW